MNRRLPIAGRPALAAAALAGAALLAAAGPATAQNFTLEGAVIDSRSATSLGVVSERGEVAQLFKAQKALTFGILRAAGIPLETLPPEVRQRLERFQTTNLDAFRAFSTGLDLKDQGRYAEAKAFFRRAADLDPGFALAADQQRAMPDVTVGTQVQARAVIATVAGQAVDRGRQAVAVDLAHALAAIQAGAAVYLLPANDASLVAVSTDLTGANAAGSGGSASPNTVAGVAFTISQAGAPDVGIAVSGEWTPDKVQQTATALTGVGALGKTTGFAAQLDAGTQRVDGSTTLADGSTVSWGTWLPAPAGSPSVRLDTAPLRAPDIGPVTWIAGRAPTQMPGTDEATFRPAGGTMTDVTGTLTVRFGQQQVSLNNLGFTIGALRFDGLNGSAGYAAASRSGAFSGNYSSGTCTGCAAFNVGASSFNGNFVGKNADGAILSTNLQTGAGTAAGVQLFKR